MGTSVEENNPTSEGKVKSEVGYKKPPKERQFGQPNGNHRNPGSWRKADTPRYKLEQMMKLSEKELLAIATNKELPYFERKVATAINQGDWKVLESMINQVYGQPKQRLEVEPVQPKPLIDLTREKKQ